MNPAPIPAPHAATARHLAARLTVVLAGLAALVAHAFLRHPRHAALIVPLWNRLNRTARRFARLMERLAAGRAPRPSRPGHSGPPPTRLPTRHGWLVVELRHQAAVYAIRLEALLAEPETIALLAAHPAAARILRPLCRMLALPPIPQPPASSSPPAGGKRDRVRRERTPSSAPRPRTPPHPKPA